MNEQEQLPYFAPLLPLAKTGLAAADRSIH